MSNVQFTSITTDEGQQFLTVFAEGKLLPPVDDSHPNFKRIKEICVASLGGEVVDVAHLVSLFDVAQTIVEQFERLSARVTVKNGVVHLDGDPVHGTLQEQILQFLDAGEEFGPLVEFYEKLLTNPLGDVREGLYNWIAGQRAEGNFTITPEGDILGYKSVKPQSPEWRTEEDVVYVPSQRGEGIVNGRDVSAEEYIEQVPGDTVEMPRSKVLHAPSRECGDGLHIGTWAYAKDFYGGSTVMLVRFSPRDIVSLPDSNASWKLRVCRYEVIGPVTEPLEVPVWSPGREVEPQPEIDLVLGQDRPDYGAGNLFEVGDEVSDPDGDVGIVRQITEDGRYVLTYPAHPEYGTITWDEYDLEVPDDEGVDEEIEESRDPYANVRGERGRFVNGRPGSTRDPKTGRFA